MTALAARRARGALAGSPAALVPGLAGGRGLDAAAGGLACCAVGAVGAGAVAGGPVDGAGACPFRAVTGMPCPFCGMTGGLMALGSGQVGRAVELAPLTPLVALAAVLVLVVVGRAALGGRAVAWSARWLQCAVVVVGAAWALRLGGAV